MTYLFPYRASLGVNGRVETFPARVVAVAVNTTGDQAAQHRASNCRPELDFTALGPRSSEKVPQTRPEPAPRRHFTKQEVYLCSAAVCVRSGSGAIYRNLKEHFGQDCVGFFRSSLLIGGNF